MSWKGRNEASLKYNRKIEKKRRLRLAQYVHAIKASLVKYGIDENDLSTQCEVLRVTKGIIDSLPSNTYPQSETSSPSMDEPEIPRISSNDNEPPVYYLVPTREGDDDDGDEKNIEEVDWETLLNGELT